MAHHEIERTYQPGPDQPVPDLSGLPGVVAVGSPQSFELCATYFDTPDLALTRAGVSLRRRTGGADEGWHLKIPSGQGRDEIRLPLARAQRTVPAELRRMTLGWTRHADLVVIATVVTQRTTYALLDDDARPLAEFADDRVTATPEGSTEPIAWREWELELVTGKPRLLKAADKLCREAGVPPSDCPRKIVRALGERAPVPLRIGKVGPGRPAGRVLQSRLVEQVVELLRHDSEIRRGLPVGVHQARVVCRRLRGALATYRPLVERDVTDPIRAELQWVQRVLGDARDAHVVRARLRALVDQEEVVIGPVRRRLDQTYRARSRAAGAVVTEMLASDRYLALLDELERLAAAPPWTDEADRPATALLRKRIYKDWKRLSRRVDALDGTRGDRSAHNDAVHGVRKAAKRLRYALEVVEPVWGEQTRPMHKLAKATTQVLGERQDTVVARQDLLSIAAGATAERENTLTYGRLHHREEVVADKQEHRFADLWGAASKRKPTAWLD
ncbi:MAG: domain containing protein [Nocardioides sp.]|nr:domain containing protein [Nocardioides sp.]